MQNLTYSSAGQLSPLLNDPYYETIGVGSAAWLAGSHGHVYSEGTQHASFVERTENGVPAEGAGTLALTADMKHMIPEFVRGVTLKGYGVSLALGIGIPIPILNEQVLACTTVRDDDIKAELIDYSYDYPMKTGKVITHLTYGQLKRGRVEIDGQKVEVSSMSSYSKALHIAELLKAEIRDGKFLLSEPLHSLPRNQKMKSMVVREGEGGEV
jgi:uncharacterized protein (DUF39 family)